MKEVPYILILSQKEVEYILQVGQYIREHLEEKISIDFLTRRFDLCEQKLRHGFEFLYKRTLNVYLWEQQQTERRLHYFKYYTSRDQSNDTEVLANVWI
jgi:AraC-like DNA-binding protein